MINSNTIDNIANEKCGRARYAPSPTGQLHLGNMQTALAAWLHARLSGYEYILRIEDLDFRRCRVKFTEQIIEDLTWLGLDWDIGPGRTDSSAGYLQSERNDLYIVALQKLIQNELLFPCICSRKKLEMHRGTTYGKLGLVYPGDCRQKTFVAKPDLTNKKQPGYALRMLAGEGDCSFDDHIFGHQRVNLKTDVGDFVVNRKDGVVAYHLAVVVDDIAQGITDIVRGADLLDSVFPQSLIYKALGEPRPRYWHMPLREDIDGEKLSKRSASPALADMRKEGFSVEAVLGLLAEGLGLIEVDSGPVSLNELLHSYTVETMQSAIKKRLQHSV
ncbi:MAG: glutamyl-tRNA synthetase [Parasphingorhabdus sp.]|jgi:glutamyl-tRNA synthetase